MPQKEFEIPAQFLWKMCFGECFFNFAIIFNASEHFVDPIFCSKQVEAICCYNQGFWQGDINGIELLDKIGLITQQVGNEGQTSGFSSKGAFPYFDEIDIRIKLVMNEIGDQSS